jgi:hypothetical protein
MEGGSYNDTIPGSDYETNAAVQGWAAIASSDELLKWSRQPMIVI